MLYIRCEYYNSNEHHCAYMITITNIWVCLFCLVVALDSSEKPRKLFLQISESFALGFVHRLCNCL